MLKTNVIWPQSRRFQSQSEWEPIGFFSEGLCNASTFDLKLGFFSSSAIHVLCDGFACFIYNGGRMRLIINDILSEQDKQSINEGLSGKPLPTFNLNDIKSLQDTLSARDKHFFNCLAYLIRHDRIAIKIIAPKGNNGIAHTKCGLFSDGLNRVAFDGSCNFSRTALLDNLESITAFCDWDGGNDIFKIKDIEEDFNRTFDEKDTNVTYIAPQDIKTRITDAFGQKNIRELLEEEEELVTAQTSSEISPTVKGFLVRAREKVEAAIDKIKEAENAPSHTLQKPQFPFKEGPRDYQKHAFDNWKNTQRGLFAMATGTGKTVTALNCLLEIYNKSGYYKAIILVPTITLVEQWENECKKFNFSSIIKVCSKYNNWKSDVANLRLCEMTNPDSKMSYIIISTYASFVRWNIFMELNQFPKNKLLLIADEAHNMSGGLMSLRLSDIKYLRRIGLSATPERQYDNDCNRQLMDFFGCSNNYTFEYSMSEAIQNGRLCRYYYYPHIVRLTDTEMEEYVEISKKIVKTMNFQNAESQERLKMLMLKRKRIIHKAANKISAFRQIVQKHLNEKGNLKYTLVYVPEGNKPDTFEADIYDKSDTIAADPETEHLIDEYTRIVRDLDPHIIVRQFTSESTDRNDMIKGFADGSIDVLTSMKCLDEGVDVPRSELAIFCASTGNPRQFIQRRGRVLRTCKGKKFAYIHDLIVIPDNIFDSDCFALEKNLVESELKRVRDFALLSENLNDTDNELQEVLNHYNLSIFN